MSNAKACAMSITQLEDIYHSCDDEISRATDILLNIDKIEVASNHPLNFILPLLYGGSSCLISSSEKVNEFLKDVHDSYAKEDGLIGTLLGHSGDNMDKMNGEFITRIETNSNIGLHRLFWGHDVFSVSKDNPFYLLTKQYGVIKGIIQVFKHLIADTFSSQGLPIPFHSWFDYTVSGEDGIDKIKNKLVDWARNTATDAAGKGVNAVEINKAFSKMFTVKAADIGATGLNTALCATHNYIMNKNDSAASSQVRLISYSTQFFGKAMYGAIKTGGVPFISWPTVMAVIKEMCIFAKINISEIRKLEKITINICKKSRELECEIFAIGKMMPGYDTDHGYINEIQRTERNFNSLLTKFSFMSSK